MNDPFDEATTIQKVGTILFTLLLYLKLLFFPHPLTHDYYPYHIKLINIFNPLSVFSLSVLALLIWIAIRGIKNRNKVSWIIFYFFVTISIVSNVLINVGAFMNERFLFVPSLAFSAFIIWLYELAKKQKSGKSIWLGFIIIAILGFGFKSYTRIPVWKNLKTLNSAAVKVSENSARANCFYGVSLYQEVLKDSIPEEKIEKIKEAEKYINKSLKIYPNYADANRMKAGLAAEHYKIDKDQDKLLKAFTEIHEVRHLNFLDEFINWLEPRANKTKMANYYYQVGYPIYAVKHKNFSRAKFYLQKGLNLNPNQQNLLFGSCVVAYLTSDFNQCIEYGSRYMALFEQSADILFYIGNAQIKSGNPLEGNKNLNLAYKLKPSLKK
jgi:tetratricopeptide (TPR) repeat protein